MRKSTAVFTIFFLLAVCAPSVASADAANYAAIDKHALAASATKEASLATLAKYLGGPCKTDVDYFAIGISPDDVLAAARDKSFSGLPELFPEARRSLRAAKIPLNKRLKSGDEVTLEFSSNEYVKMVAANAGAFTMLTKDANKLVATLRLKKRELLIGGMKAETDRQFKGLLRYTVE